MDLLITILAIALAPAGLMGGIWFWQKMAESPIFAQMRSYVKIAGLCSVPVLFAIVIFLVWMMKTQPPEFFRQFIPPMNILSWFLCFYMLGYDASILRPEPRVTKASHGNEKNTLKFQIKWDLLKKVLFLSILAIVPAVALLQFSAKARDRALSSIEGLKVPDRTRKRGEMASSLSRGQRVFLCQHGSISSNSSQVPSISAAQEILINGLKIISRARVAGPRWSTLRQNSFIQRNLILTPKPANANRSSVGHELRKKHLYPETYTLYEV